MGQRMSDKPHIYGNDCGYWPDPTKTPKYLYVRFSGIIKCPDWNAVEYETPPNDRVFKLTQNPLVACSWLTDLPDWQVIVSLSATPGSVILWLHHLPDGRVYFYDTPVMTIDEGYVYNNLHKDCLMGRASYNGIATVTWIHEATALLESINMQRADDLFMEMRPLIDGNKVYKFCKLKDATNISIEFEPD